MKRSIAKTGPTADSSTAISTPPVGPSGRSRQGRGRGREDRASCWAHTGSLGLSDPYLVPEYVGYPSTAAASLYPMNADVADLAHAQGALFGYVHPFDTPPDPSDTTAPLTYELPVDVALGRVDYMAVMGYSA